MDLDTYSSLIERIYDAATDRALWPVALHSIGGAFRSHATSLIFRDMTTREGRWLSTLDPDAEAEYFGTWRDRNILTDRKQDWRPFVVDTDRNFISRADLWRSEFYTGFMRPRDIETIMWTLLRREAAVQPSLTIARPASAGDFDAAEVDLVRRLTPHMQHAIALSQRLRDTKIGTGDAADALDLLGHAILILDETGAPLHLNRAAERMMRSGDGISLPHGRLQAATPAATAQLTGAIANAAGRGTGMAIAGVAQLERPSGRRPLIVLAMPMRGETGWLTPSRRLVLLCITDPAATSGLPLDRAAALYRLTRAETSVARELVGDRDVAEIAQRLHTSVNTVRTHLARLMAKTETRRQSELVRLLSSLPLLDEADSDAHRGSAPAAAGTLPRTDHQRPAPEGVGLADGLAAPDTGAR